MHPEVVYLFGSRARGDGREDSDYDLLVVVPDDTPKDQRSPEAASAIPRDPGIPADIVACRRSVFERRRHRIGTLSYKATRGGIVVYGG